MDLKKYIRSIPDYPKKGILFRDITTLIKSPQAFKYTVDKIIEISSGEHAQKRTKETIGASLVLGPLGALVGLFGKEKRTQFAVEYVDTQNQTNIALIDIKAKDSEALIQDLESLTGLKIRTTENPQ